MRPTPNMRIEPMRCLLPGHEVESLLVSGTNCGLFRCRRKGVYINMIGHDGTEHQGIPGRWEHVSVSLAHRTPTWDEMCFAKDLFWDEEEEAVQFHPKKSQYVNYHPYCLHLWRPIGLVVPAPPTIMIGPKPARTEEHDGRQDHEYAVGADHQAGEHRR